MPVDLPVETIKGFRSGAELGNIVGSLYGFSLIHKVYS